MSLKRQLAILISRQFLQNSGFSPIEAIFISSWLRRHRELIRKTNSNCDETNCRLFNSNCTQGSRFEQKKPPGAAIFSSKPLQRRNQEPKSAEKNTHFFTYPDFPERSQTFPDAACRRYKRQTKKAT